MSEQNKTEIVVILDRSGSMQRIRHDMEAGLDEIVSEQRAFSDDDCAFTLVQFDNRYEKVLDQIPIDLIRPIRLHPRGSTALLDAVGETLTSLVARNPQGKVVVMIVTDGHENASQFWTRSGVQRLVQDCEERGWEILFLGANIDAFTEGRRIGIDRAKAVDFDPNTRSVRRALKTMSAKTAAYRGGRARGMDFTSEEREEIKPSGNSSRQLH